MDRQQDPKERIKLPLLDLKAIRREPAANKAAVVNKVVAKGKAAANNAAVSRVVNAKAGANNAGVSRAVGDKLVYRCSSGGR